MIDLVKIESKWQKRWEESRAFEAKKDESKQKALMAIPYPYTSGPLHIGHGRTYTLADVWIRYKRMAGFNAFWPMGFHITGTPIVSVSNKIAEGDSKTIDLYTDYVRQYENDESRVSELMKGFVDPQKVADYFADVIIQDFQSLGFSIDWTRKFTTGDLDYNKFIEWQFLKLKDKGLVKKGTHPVLFCLKEQNAVGEDDIKDGDVLSTSIQEFTAIKFAYDDGFIVAATLRPETVFGLTNIWINPDEEYSKIKANGEILYVSSDAALRLSHQIPDMEIIEKFSGKDLLWKECKSPVEERKVPILPASFVDVKNASGVVYCVPAHAPYDYIALSDIQKEDIPESVKSIKPISIIKIPKMGDFPAKEICQSMGVSSQKDSEKLDEATKKIYKEEFYSGTLKENCGQFAGIKINQIKDEVKKHLKDNGLAFSFFVSETPGLVSRSGGEVVVKLLQDQWFIDYGNAKWKEDAKKCLDSMLILPEHYRKLFEHTIDWVHERACARKRGLGTRLPWDENWIIESLSDSTIYPAFYLAVHKIREGIKPDQLKPEFFDFVFLGEGDLSEVSKSCNIDELTLKEIHQEFEYWYPVDERHTAIGHISNHLTFYIFNHVAIFPQKNWPQAITLNEFVIREGSKMSKSKGNVIPLTRVSSEYGSDLYRLFITSSADLDTIVDWSEESVQSVRRRLHKLFSIKDSVLESEQMEIRDIDKWLESRFNSKLKDTQGCIERFELRDFSQMMFFDMINDFAYYQKRSGKINKTVAIEILRKWCQVLSPIIPHTCEEIWESLDGQGFVSLSNWPKIDKSRIDKKSQIQEEVVRGVLDDIIQVQKMAKIENPKQVRVFVSQKWKYRAYDMIRNGGDIGSLMKDDEIKSHGKDVPKFAQSLIKKKFSLGDILKPEEELDALQSASDFLSRESGIKVAIESGEDSDNPKSKVAAPCKPGILLE